MSCIKLFAAAVVLGGCQLDLIPKPVQADLLSLKCVGGAELCEAEYMFPFCDITKTMECF